MEDRWLTVAEAADRLAMNPEFIYRACASMGLKRPRVGRGRAEFESAPRGLTSSRGDAPWSLPLDLIDLEYYPEGAGPHRDRALHTQ
jgi:hypothetical protein